MEEPIYTFDRLKRTLTDMGYLVEKATGYREVENVDVDINDLRTKIDFTDEGIFLKDEEGGAPQQIFLYKQKYHLEKYGLPRFHICKCQTIQSFMNSGSFEKEYRRANTKSVMVKDMDDRLREKMVENLPLCKYCARLAMEYDKEMKTSEFVEILKRANETEEEPQNVEVDIFGYTKDWEKISTAYRISKDYTCERCGLHIDNVFDRQYMHVHHRDGNKLHNHTSNLECLCIRCHAHTDAIHEHNFSRGANRIHLEQFNADYPKK